MRVLVVTNLVPDAGYPARGQFVRDQVAALRELGIDVEELGFPPGSRHYIPAVRAIRRRLRERRYDLVHAHYGLAGWCARLAGADPLAVTFHGTDVRHPVSGRLSQRLAPRMALVAGASQELFEERLGRPGLPVAPARCAVLPCGADVERFRPIERRAARSELGLDPERRYLLLPADPERPVKRADRARELAAVVGAELLTAGRVEPERMPLWVNAADAVLITSDYEGFGLAGAEALACDVAVLATPVGIAPSLLAGIEGCHVSDFDLPRWSRAALAVLDRPDPRVAGRARAERLSSTALAERVAVAYEALVEA